MEDDYMSTSPSQRTPLRDADPVLLGLTELRPVPRVEPVPPVASVSRYGHLFRGVSAETWRKLVRAGEEGKVG